MNTSITDNLCVPHDQMITGKNRAFLSHKLLRFHICIMETTHLETDLPSQFRPQGRTLNFHQSGQNQNEKNEAIVTKFFRPSSTTIKKNLTAILWFTCTHTRQYTTDQSKRAKHFDFRLLPVK